MYAPIGCFRRTRRTCRGYPQRLPGSKLATVQGTFHAQYSGAYSSQGQRELCSDPQDHLAGSHQRAGPQAGRRNLPTVRAPFSQSHPLLRRWLGGLSSVLFLPAVGCKKDFFHQRAGTAEPGDSPPYRCDRDISQRRCLHQAGHHLPHGICGRLV